MPNMDFFYAFQTDGAWISAGSEKVILDFNELKNGSANRKTDRGGKGSEDRGEGISTQTEGQWYASRKQNKTFEG